MRPHRDPESGQALVWAAGALVAGAFVALLVARTAADRHRRDEWQTRADAAAMAAATGYARGLNVVVHTNRLLAAAAVADAVQKLTGIGFLASAGGKLARAAGLSKATSFTGVVMGFQDLWAGTAGGSGAAGVAPIAMAAIALAAGEANGVTVVPLWNGRRGPSALTPSLNLRRADLADVAAALSGKTRVPLTRRAGTGKTSKLVTDLLDLPMPLVEREHPAVHRVVLVVRPHGTGIGEVFVVAAETGNGRVFDATYGTPSFAARLVAPPGGLAADPGMLRLLASPGTLRSWLTRATRGWATGRASEMIAGAIGGRG